LTKLLQGSLQLQLDFPVEVAMRYGNPSPREAYESLRKKIPDLDEVILIPLYPHYAMSSYETAVAYMKEVHKKEGYDFSLSVLKPFYNNPGYINALAESIRPFLNQDYDKILFSYHGVPERHILKGDITGHHCLQVQDCCNKPSPAHAFCYRHQCITTTNKVVEMLNIPPGKFELCFQSRLGRDKWLPPYTAQRLTELPGEGVKKILVACPAFTSDCLETLEEMAEQGMESFMHHGGENFTLIPCLNIQPLWVNTLANWIKSYMAGNDEMILA
jgi:ferrochelatase